MGGKPRRGLRTAVLSVRLRHRPHHIDGEVRTGYEPHLGLRLPRRGKKTTMTPALSSLLSRLSTHR